MSCWSVISLLGFLKYLFTFKFVTVKRNVHQREYEVPLKSPPIIMAPSLAIFFGVTCWTHIKIENNCKDTFTIKYGCIGSNLN